MKLLVLFCLGAITAGAAALAPSSVSPEIQRLVDLARLWVTVEYFHPAIAHPGVDWDKALVDNLPALRVAKDNSQLRAALASLLQPLGTDNQTYLESDEPHPGAASGAGAFMRLRFHHGLASPDSESPFYTGFVERWLSAPSAVTVPVGPVSVHLRTSEPVTSPVSAPGASRLAQSPYPGENDRILAGFRLWGAVRYFFAHKDAVDEDWDGLLADYLPKLIAAKDAQSFHLAIAEWVSHLSDSQSNLDSSVLDQYLGTAHPPVRVRLIEKKPVIVQLTPEAAKAGLRLGDLVTRVDGESSVDRVKREANYLSASTPASLSELVSEHLLNGPDGSQAQLDLVRNEKPLSVILSRTKAPLPLLQEPDPSASNIRYFNLVDRKQLPQLPPEARAIIFDLRGETEINGPALASRFEGTAGAAAYISTSPIALAPDLPQPGYETNTASDFQMVSVPSSAPSKLIKTQIVVLIDARTRGNAERVALQLLAGGKARSVGSASAGAPSEQAQLTLPGALTVRFSGQDIRATNGAPIQRQGITPYLPVPVTLNGVRAGRDEPLEAALHAVSGQ